MYKIKLEILFTKKKKKKKGHHPSKVRTEKEDAITEKITI